MLSTEPVAEVAVSAESAQRSGLEEAGEVEDKPCHVVLKPTPQRPVGSERGPPDGRPRAVAAFSSAGTGAFTAYVPKSRQGEATPTGSQLAQPTAATPVRVWTDVGTSSVHGLPPTLEYQRPYFPLQHYLPRTVENEQTSDNSDHSDQEAYPIDLTNKSRRRDSESSSYDVPDHSPKYFTKQDIVDTIVNHDAGVRENEAEQRNMSPGVKQVLVYDSTSTWVSTPSHLRQQTVIIRNSFLGDNSQESAAEYTRFTFRNHTARAEVFEMRRNYAARGDAALPHFAGEDADTRSVDASSDTNPPPEGDSDMDEEIDVVSDEPLQPGGGSGEEQQWGNDADSDSCGAQALDCRVVDDSQRSSSSCPADASSSSSSPGLGHAADPQDKEASWGVFSVEDLLLRNRVLVILWSLLGEARLLEVGYPHAPVHRVLWLTVDVCCSVAGMKSAAAVPLASDHDCRDDMLCFRDHTHRFLEVCAPTRDMWKQFGWAGLTVDAVARKIYEEELRPRLSKLVEDQLPPVIRRALLRLERLEELLEVAGGGDVKIALPSVGAAASRLPPVARGSADQQPASGKKKRGRPAKASHKSDPGRIERVMLWRFLLNLLEDPRNKPCIHWVQREEGIFRILNTDWLARLWGRRHGNPRMTYEKMARAMRTYYRSKVLQPVPRTRNLPRKLIYKFNPAVIHKVSSNKYAPFSDRGLNYNTTTTAATTITTTTTTTTTTAAEVAPAGS